MIRLCEKHQHLIATKVCGICNAAVGPALADRQRPVRLHPRSKQAIALRALRRKHGVGAGVYQAVGGVLLPSEVISL